MLAPSRVGTSINLRANPFIGDSSRAYNGPSRAGNPPTCPFASDRASNCTGYLQWLSCGTQSCVTVAMTNITVSVDEETYRRSRIKAAEIGTSVSALVRAYLSDLVEHGAPESRFDRLRRLQDETLEAIRSRGSSHDQSVGSPRRWLCVH